jgi:DNA-binding GntR family transcriptional regulator
VSVSDAQGSQQESRALPAGDWVAASLRQRIIEGHLRPGAPLREATLTSELGVARHTLRGALRLLEREGLIIHQMHRGAVVKALSTQDVHEIYRVRRVLEISAIEDSGMASQSLLDKMEAAVELAERAVANEAWNEVGTASLRFHQSLVGLLGSPSIDEFFRSILAQLRLAFAIMRDEGQWQTPWIPRDREICDLIRGGRRDDAKTLTRQYLADSERGVLDAVRANEVDQHRSARRRTSPGGKREA